MLPNMKIRQIFLLLSPIFPFFLGGKSYGLCPSEKCGNFQLFYPFKIQNLLPQDNCTISLACNPSLGQGTPIVNLPDAGDFYVRDIDNYDQHIQLYDPGNCTMKRLMMNWNLSSSPYKSTSSENYTFYMCPSDTQISYSFPINCLSNSTNSTLAFNGVIDQQTMHDANCSLIGSWLLPVLYVGQFDIEGVNDDLYLKWNVSTCADCKETHDRLPGRSNCTVWDKLASRVLAICFSFSFIIIYCSLQVMKCRRANQMDQMNAASHPPNEIAAAASQSNTTGIDESTINICTELVVLSESKIIPGPDFACSICLESYEVGDTVRNIAKCEHFFHGHCIELWLAKNRTCPVCRTTILDVSE